MTVKEKLAEIKSRQAPAISPEDGLALELAIKAVEYVEKQKALPPQIQNLNGKKVILLNATQDSMNWRTHFTLFKNYAMYGPDKIGLIPQGQTVIHEARNMLAQQGLQTDAEWFIIGPDDDLVLPCGDKNITNGYFNARLPDPLCSENAIERLMRYPPEIRVVGALYFVKGSPAFSRHRNAGRAVCEQAFRDDEFNRKLHLPSKDSGLIKQDWVAVGFTRIHRSVFEEIAQAADGRWPEILPSHKGGHYGWFQPIGPDVNEDVSFGRRCKALGIQHYLDSGLVCGHADGTSIFWAHNTIST